MLKSYYSAEEVLQLLNKKSSPNLSYKDLKDLCLRDKLTPAIYFEGNIVCIHEERSPNEIDARELGPHERSVSWTSIFKGYLHSRDFLDFLESSTVSNPKTDVFFRFEKIIECLESENEIKLLNQNEYLKAFSRMTDDDIRNIRWLIEAHHFEGNPFSSTDIVFHHQEVQRLLDPEQNETNLKFIDYSDNKFLSKVLKQLFYDPITAACLMTGDDPAQLEVLKAANQKLYEVKYPENFEALTLILRAIEMGILKANSDLIISEIPLKEFLVERGYIINGFNKIHYDGTYFPYHYDKKRFKQPIPLNLSKHNPLSEINYLKFKIEKLETENSQLSDQVNNEKEKYSKISDEIIKIKSRVNSIPQESLSGLQLKNQFDKDKQGMMRIIADHLWKSEDHSDKCPHEISELVRKEMLFYCDETQLPKKIQTIKRYITSIAPSHHKRPGRRPAKVK